MLKERIITAVIGIPVLLGFLFWGRIPFFLLLTSIIVLALLEFVSLFRKCDVRPDILLVLPGGIILCFSALFYGTKGFTLGIVLIVFITLVRMLFSNGSFLIKSAALTIFAPIYIGLMMGHLILIRDIETNGIILVFSVFLATWICDISAYALGSLFGKRKLAPMISPHKTWEGAIGSFFITTLIIGGLWFIPLSFFERAMLGAVAVVSGQFGDLVESKLKREVGVKDSGTMLPGHGGILDRFDSLIFSAPAVFYFLKLLPLK